MLYHQRREEYLRTRCAEQLSGIRAPRPFSIEEFCERLGSGRGRPLHLHPLPEVGGVEAPCGIFVSFDETDHIFHVIGTSKRHREQIIRHELAHMLLGHHVTSDTSAIVAVLSHLIDPDKIRAAFGRASYDTQQERDAELAASFLGEIIDNLPADNAGDNGLDDVLAHPRKRESGRYT